MFRTRFASIVRSITNCSSSHWFVSWVRSRIVIRRIRLIQWNKQDRHITQCTWTSSPHRIHTRHTHTARDRSYAQGLRGYPNPKRGTTTLYIAQRFTTTHSVHHQAIKPIEPLNIIHTANDSYTGFILLRTHDTHQWLLLQFVILLTMDANCVRNM